jgi:dCTP deaminase
MRSGQISFVRMSSPVDRPYGSASLGSKYQGQSEPTASAFHRDFAEARSRDQPADAAARPAADGDPPRA